MVFESIHRSIDVDVDVDRTLKRLKIFFFSIFSQLFTDKDLSMHPDMNWSSGINPSTVLGVRIFEKFTIKLKKILVH